MLERKVVVSSQFASNRFASSQFSALLLDCPIQVRPAHSFRSLEPLVSRQIENVANGRVRVYHLVDETPESQGIVGR